ncbi:hypothetical protein GM708_05780 [Vibrio cholerae]|jgi:hypothetical protein|nr:hypothetical protein [Vibrio cholerae]
MTETTARNVARSMAVRLGGSHGLADQVATLRAEVEQLRADVVRLDGDLDESRRLNLRAAELLDMVYEELGARRSGREETP